MIHFENWSVDSKKRREIRKEEMGLGGYKLTHLHLFYIDRSLLFCLYLTLVQEDIRPGGVFRNYLRYDSIQIKIVYFNILPFLAIFSPTVC